MARFDPDDVALMILALLRKEAEEGGRDGVVDMVMLDDHTVFVLQTGGEHLMVTVNKAELTVR